MLRDGALVEEVVDPTSEQRFVSYFREPDTDDPGLVLTQGGDVYLVNPDGTRTQLPGGGGGDGLPRGWTQDASDPANVSTHGASLDFEGGGIGGGNSGGAFQFGMDSPGHPELFLADEDQSSLVWGANEGFLVNVRGIANALLVDTHGQTTLGAVDADALASLLIKPTGEGIDQSALIVCADGNQALVVAPNGPVRIAPVDMGLGSSPGLSIDMTGLTGSGITLQQKTFDDVLENVAALGNNYTFPTHILSGLGGSQILALNQSVVTGGFTVLTVGQHGEFDLGMKANDKYFTVYDLADAPILVAGVDVDNDPVVGFFDTGPVVQQDATDGPSLIDALIAYGLLDSGSTWSGGSGILPTGWSVDSPFVGDFLYDADGRTINFGPAGDPTDPDSGLHLEMVCIAETTIELFGGPTVAYLNMLLPDGAQVRAGTDSGIISRPDGSPAAFSADGGGGAISALDAGNLTIDNLADPTTAQQAATKAYVDARSETTQVENLSSTTVTLPSGTSSTQTWSKVDGADLLDLTDPNNPVFAANGTYLVVAYGTVLSDPAFVLPVFVGMNFGQAVTITPDQTAAGADTPTGNAVAVVEVSSPGTVVGANLFNPNVSDLQGFLYLNVTKLSDSIGGSDLPAGWTIDGSSLAANGGNFFLGDLAFDGPNLGMDAGEIEMIDDFGNNVFDVTTGGVAVRPSTGDVAYLAEGNNGATVALDGGGLLVRNVVLPGAVFDAQIFSVLGRAFEDTMFMPLDTVHFTGGTYNRPMSVPPITVGSSGLIATFNGFSVQNIDTTNDGYDLSAQMIVFNADGSETITINGGGFIPAAGPGQTATIAAGDMSVTGQVGSDLSYDSGTGDVTSAAGGTYAVCCFFAGEWD